MKTKWLVSSILLAAFCLSVSQTSYAQDKKKVEKKTAKKFKVDDKFMTTWKKVGSLTKEIRSFKTPARLGNCGNALNP